MLSYSMSKMPAKEVKTTSGNQLGSPSKSRLVLSRTLVLVLNPLSDACSTPVHRLTCKKIGRVFDDFKKCNKHGISVLLRDAVDDIDLVGWISPFTLLIHGSSEDMDTIEQAWVGRMLKPPEDFVIKDFGEISAVNMKQIPQSQFISICETLHQIITSLNENQISATLECIISRLCSSFDSVVIPPLSAVRKSLDLLVKEKKLGIIDGSYYARNTKNSHILSKAFPVDELHPCSVSCIQGRKNTIKSGTVQLSKRRTTMKEVSMEESKIKEDVEILEGRESARRKRKGNKDISKGRNREARLVKNDIKQRRENNRERRNKHRSKPFLQNRKVSKKCISEGNYSFNEFTNQDTSGHLETDFAACKKKQSEKRFSFFGKLSRLFKTKSSEEDDNEECESGPEHQLNDDGEHVVHDERAKLVPEYCKETKNDKESKTKKNKYFEKSTNVKKSKTTYSSKRNDKKEQEELRRRPVSKQQSCANRYNISQKREYVQNSTSSEVKRCSRLPPSVHLCSSSECSRTDWESVRQNIDMDSGKSERNNKQGSRDHHRYNGSSWSETSGSSNHHKSDEYFSSDTSSELTRKPFHYSSATLNDENARRTVAEDAFNFCSTQAICGDLEQSTTSLNPAVAHVKQCGPFSPAIDEVMVNTKSQIMPFIYQNRQSGEERNELQSRNLLQLIGVL